jgi:hypothetical protein
MDFPANLSHWTPWIDGGSVVAVAYGVAKVFDYFEGLISDRSRVALWYHLADIPSDERIDSWGAVFPKLIDRVFGERALSWKFVSRSCIASLISVGITLALHLRFKHSRSGPSLDLVLLNGIAANCFPDYGSILVSRFIVRKMTPDSTVLKIAFLLVIDFVVTTIVALIGTTIIFMVSHFREYFWPDNDIDRMFPFYRFHLMAHGDFGFQMSAFHITQTLGIFFYAAFFTSIWVWI